MEFHRTTRTSMLLLSSLLATSCMGSDGATPDEAEPAVATTGAPASQEIIPGAVRFMRMHPKADAILEAATSADKQVERIASLVPAAAAHLTYYGGPVMSHAKVVQVNWNSSVRFQSELASFYAAVTNSRHMDWLVEYATPTQTIGRGSFLTSVVDPQPPTGTTMTDAKIQQEIQRLINAGTVPPPDADTIYMMHFPPGLKITQGGQSSCQAFCAYHGSYTSGGQRVIYGVIPDMGGNCANGCGSSTPVNNTQVCASHELVEAITDPAVAEATVDGPPLGWYDNTNGEIGDICAQFEGTIDGIYVQAEWSNSLNDCILKNDAVPPPSNNNTFSLTVSPASQTVVAGNSTSYTITTAVTAGSAEQVALTVTGLPTGASASISPTSVAAGSTATITVNTVVSAPAATATLGVKGVAASSTVNGSATLKIQAAVPPPTSDAAPPHETPDAAVPPPPGQPDANTTMPPPVGQPDAGGTPETPGDGGASGGCGCSVGGADAHGGLAGGLATFALAGLVVLSRRRKRG